MEARRLVADPAGPADAPVRGGSVEVGGGLVRSVGTSGAAAGGGNPHDRFAVEWLVPGFVDLHTHGGGGADMGAGPEQLTTAVAFHGTHGTTSTLVSLVSAPVEVLCRQLAQVADVAERDSGVLGAHLEGPFLSYLHAGAHDPAQLRFPDPETVERLIVAGRGRLRSVTIAPELPGSDAAIEAFVAAGVVVAIGHTDADYEQAMRAFDHGASLATHLFNAMPPLHHRKPGAVVAALRSGARCEVIGDGVHVHPSLVSLVAERADRLVLVTDAMAAAGVADGDYELGGSPVRVRDGVARLPGTGALAGSTMTMDLAVRRAVHAAGLSPVAAIRAATATPADVLDGVGAGRSGSGAPTGLGRIAVGGRADLVGLDADLRVTLVVRAGQVVTWNPRPGSGGAYA